MSDTCRGDGPGGDCIFREHRRVLAGLDIAMYKSTGDVLYAIQAADENFEIINDDAYGVDDHRWAAEVFTYLSLRLHELSQYAILDSRSPHRPLSSIEEVVVQALKGDDNRANLRISKVGSLELDEAWVHGFAGYRESVLRKYRHEQQITAARDWPVPVRFYMFYTRMYQRRPMFILFFYDRIRTSILDSLISRRAFIDDLKRKSLDAGDRCHKLLMKAEHVENVSKSRKIATQAKA